MTTDYTKVRNLKEIAELAGVSTATVSRALTGTGRVNDETRARIAALAQKLGYHPNIVARNLRKQKTSTVGVLVPLGHEDIQHLSDPFFNAMTGFLADALAELGYDLLLSRVIPRDELWVERLANSGRVDGVLVIGQSNQFGALEAIARRYRPLVVWGGHYPGQIHCAVGSQNRKGGRMAARHLIERGCRRIAFAGPTEGPEFGERFAGVCEVVAEAGLGDGLIRLPTHFELNAAYSDILDLLRATPLMPDGIVAGADVSAIGVIRALGALGYRVPDDVRVVGYDGLPIGELLTPPLTTVDQQLRHGAGLMVDLLMRRIAGEDAPGILIDPVLIVRGST
ncbi:LacI family DNA-binding transcriptional regulator [Novosphingobium sp. FSW06-99]|uniref:LacI family DNA-binding transcriptional regulator n=1 Tax=Novosphingobium sp. FSW06-99 TaxID=1739113 RepID=UPI00076CD31F|nr:LacI family DNA-binding transcriptional regulator [Novosphingobium sp. FSW06-99]KUR79847.1 LacI family transcriptional regulator [Novosphingobium sp. FSW06-99]